MLLAGVYQEFTGFGRALRLQVLLRSSGLLGPLGFAGTKKPNMMRPRHAGNAKGLTDLPAIRAYP